MKTTLRRACAVHVQTLPTNFHPTNRTFQHISRDGISTVEVIWTVSEQIIEIPREPFIKLLNGKLQVWRHVAKQKLSLEPCKRLHDYDSRALIWDWFCAFWAAFEKISFDTANLHEINEISRILIH